MRTLIILQRLGWMASVMKTIEVNNFLLFWHYVLSQSNYRPLKGWEWLSSSSQSERCKMLAWAQPKRQEIWRDRSRQPKVYASARRYGCWWCWACMRKETNQHHMRERRGRRANQRWQEGTLTSIDTRVGYDMEVTTYDTATVLSFCPAHTHSDDWQLTVEK
jgi:hypothetical protein